MIYNRFNIALPLLAMLLSQPATAGPMGFDESFMAMATSIIIGANRLLTTLLLRVMH